MQACASMRHPDGVSRVLQARRRCLQLHPSRTSAVDGFDVRPFPRRERAVPGHAGSVRYLSHLASASSRSAASLCPSSRARSYHWRALLTSPLTPSTASRFSIIGS